MVNIVLDQDIAHSHEQGHEDAGSLRLFGFWVYLMTDCILFATLFASYAVLRDSVAGGPSTMDVFELPYVLAETLLLLLSSITYGFAMLAMNRDQRTQVLRWLGLTALLGLGFVAMEINEFHQLISEGHGPDRSGFLSAFFTLVGTHGLHVACGLVWMAVLMWQVHSRGLGAIQATRLSCLSLFWHFLDVIWICVFTVVYLLGVA
ncbi:cytochrome o ubiquinol oxidase subunit III [Pseudomonas protegens]|jgi:cytochrome o ubiquinol oxidase subunit 3|uniref:Cytochrome bo(3) ubiquinol oxidase subunit 3 n=2 Tax=Pseudomonas protegens TaxID=380021 RepID=Q4K7G8_PSEF5|nr:cytochrome o ubiquinol oxidase subunit III [Pseudomonas protegens]AAY93964.1 cytochrome o ubiquinol oxidase, subunit III [Pseudomonas protegens Pf-5]ASE21853.1 cytochrome o ubiquinol oxidase subunit III [Pseudomonas protegens]QEZ54462.1 cytochrome o ubiquinol oxidase subunit III [Pseudomonas protegens]QEZ59334.1 cytochrome o ubiquinol oxidase subunit III [Pseudomonas protegens]QEZ65751.1 cytochrome o ubiquinol oxidase subunit III [Pseudomonas protegens]